MKLFSEQEIIETYNQHVLKDINYFTKVSEGYKNLNDEEKNYLNSFSKYAMFKVSTIGLPSGV